MKNNILFLFLPFCFLLLTACGGGGGSDGETLSNAGSTADNLDISDESTSEATSSTLDAENSNSSNANSTHSLIESAAQGSIIEGEVETIDLGFAKLSVKSIPLPNDKHNAKEVYQLAHYIGRTDAEINEDDIDIPIRSYQAACNINSSEPRLFVSTSLADDSSHDNTYGSVYELVYSSETGSFSRTGNAVTLPMCYESHGVAVSADCSRVAVLCNTRYQASESYDIAKDVVEEHGSTWMKMEDNHSAIDTRISSDFGRLIVTNHKKYLSFFTDHNSLNFSDYLAGLQSNFPDKNFDADSSFSDFKGGDMTEPMDYILGQIPSAELEALKQLVRDGSYKENDQIWLLEWNHQTLSQTPDAYVVNKMHGGTHLGAQELIYVESDSKERSSYGFSVTARVFDDNGGSHYSAGLTVVNRSDWSVDLSGDDRRSWYWLCGDGHVANIRAFYNPGTEMYGAICTSDWNDWIGKSHGQLGTIAIKMEDAGSSISEGRAQYFVPSTAAMITNGGGHTVVPVDANTNLSVIVAPKLIADTDMDRFLINEVGIANPSSGGPFDTECADYDTNNCFFSYISYNYWADSNDYPSITRQGLYSGEALDSSSLTRIGVGKVDGRGSISDSQYKWLVEDDDCQISDPQLIDLKNGRYLMGYAKFQCISDSQSYERSYSKRGANRMLKAKGYYLMEIDVDGNILEGPVQLPNQGWGGLDEPVYLGDGKVAWLYIKDPLIDYYGGGQQQAWDVMVYQSNSVN